MSILKWGVSYSLCWSTKVGFHIIKNEFIKRANTVQQGNFVPKWKYDDMRNTVIEQPEVKVIINGQRYNIIWVRKEN